MSSRTSGLSDAARDDRRRWRKSELCEAPGVSEVKRAISAPVWKRGTLNRHPVLSTRKRHVPHMALSLFVRSLTRSCVLFNLSFGQPSGTGILTDASNIDRGRRVSTARVKWTPDLGPGP